MKRLLLIAALSFNSVAFAHCAGAVPCEMKYVDVAFLKTTRTGADLEKAKHYIELLIALESGATMTSTSTN